jgi:4-hydroxybenzoate polyprenyltransferase
MAFNRLVDAPIDGQNPRTRDRHLPAGTLSFRQVLIFFVVMVVGFIASCALFLPNWLPLAGSLPVLAWICGYSLAKRFTAAAHLWLGVALALAPVCAWVGIRGEAVIAQPVELLPALMLAVAIAFWVAGFDIIYACQDADFDRQVGLHSVPARLGVAGALRVAAGLHLLMLIALAGLPWLEPGLSLGWLYYAALGWVTVLVIRQHALVSPGNLQKVGIAFFQINAIISLGFCTLAAVDAGWRTAAPHERVSARDQSVNRAIDAEAAATMSEMSTCWLSAHSVSRS